MWGVWGARKTIGCVFFTDYIKINTIFLGVPH